MMPVSPSGLKYEPPTRSAQTGVRVRHVRGRCMTTTGWRVTVNGISTPAIAASRAPQGPATFTTIGEAISSLSVTTPAILPCSMRRAVTVVRLTIATPSRFAASAKLFAASAGSA